MPAITHRAFILVGPTAVGKTTVAHILARQAGWNILSADSMLVYRGMDVGTAKPSPAEQREVRYAGIDLINPDQGFSVGDYVRHAADALQPSSGEEARVIITGGTGLYIQRLVHGLDELPAADPAIRAGAERLLADEGLQALQNELKKQDPDRYALIKDKANPRRLIRALELAVLGTPLPGKKRQGNDPVLIGLNLPVPLLGDRIRQRVQQMYEAGLLDEARGLREKYGKLSYTAMQAIGYAEAFEVLDGRCHVQEAVAKTILRTKQLAKRQMTWFRNQANVVWIEMTSTKSIEDTADAVSALWKLHGSTPLAF